MSTPFSVWLLLAVVDKGVMSETEILVCCSRIIVYYYILICQIFAVVVGGD